MNFVIKAVKGRIVNVHCNRYHAELGADKQTCDSFSLVMSFLSSHPDMITRCRHDELVTDDFIRRKARGFFSGRQSKVPVLPSTVPDPAVKEILEHAYHVDPRILDSAIELHMQAMGAENFIGWALEAYVATHAEKEGWTWCSGEIVRYVDFIRLDGDTWKMLQIKNRDNSENSASSSVRIGTSIKKWFRTFSTTGYTNWDAFPDISLKQKLSEDGFRTFILEWLKNLHSS